MLSNTPMRLPRLPDGYFWDLHDDGDSSRNYTWRVVKLNGDRFMSGSYRNHPFGLNARMEVRIGAIRARFAVAADKRKAATKEQARLASMALDQQRAQARLAITAAREADVRARDAELREWAGRRR